MSDHVQMVKAVVEIYKTGNQLVKGVGSLYHKIFHGGMEKYGSVIVKDKNDRVWKIKVRWKGNRGHYLKFKDWPKKIKEEAFRAGTTACFQYPDEYRELLQEEWEAFALFADGNSEWAGRPDPKLREVCRAILHRLIYGVK